MSQVCDLLRRGGAGVPRPPEHWLLLVRLLGLVPEFPSLERLQGDVTFQWVEAALQSGAVSAVAGVLDAVLDMHVSNPELPVPGEAMCVLPIIDALERMWVAVFMKQTAGILEAADAVANVGWSRCFRLLQQLTDEAVVRAVSRAPVFVERRLWSVVKAASVVGSEGNDSGNGSGDSGDGRNMIARAEATAPLRRAALLSQLVGPNGNVNDVDGGVGGRGRHPQHDTANGVLQLRSPRDEAAFHAFYLLCHTATYISGMLEAMWSLKRDCGKVLGTRFMELLKRSRAAASLCSALLAAPSLCFAEGPREAAAIWAFAAAQAQKAMLHAVHAMANPTGDGNVPDDLGALMAPEVLHFLREALRQLAAAADRIQVVSEPHSADLPRSGLVDRSGAAAGTLGDGEGRASDGRPFPPLPPQLVWPMMQLRLITRFGSGAAASCPARALAPSVICCMRAQAFVTDVVSSSGMMDLLAVGLLPDRREAAAWGARALRLTHACLVALVKPGRPPGTGEQRSGASAAVGRGERAGHGSGVTEASAPAEEVSIPGGKPVQLVLYAQTLAQLVMRRMRGAREAEQLACLADLLEMAAWLAGIAATLIVTWPEAARGVTGAPVYALSILSYLLQGVAFWGLGAEDQGIPNMPAAGAELWKKLSPEARAACLQRLAPTDLARSLDVLLRESAARGVWEPQPYRQLVAQLVAQGEDGSTAPVLLSTALAELLGPLAHTRLVAWRQQQQRQQQEGSRQRQEEQCRAHGDCGSGGGAGGGAGAAGATDDDDGSHPQGPGPGTGPGQRTRGWQLQGELGLLLTAVKLLRRQVAVVMVQDAAWASAPQLSAVKSARVGLASFLKEMVYSDCGLLMLLEELLGGWQPERPCTPSEASTSAATKHSAHSATSTAAEPPQYGDLFTSAVKVAQAVAACGTAVLPYWLTVLGQRIAERRPRSPASASSSTSTAVPAALFSDMGAFDTRPVVISACCSVICAIRDLPPEALVEAAPQRLLAAIARLVWGPPQAAASEPGTRGGAGGGGGDDIVMGVGDELVAMLKPQLSVAVMLLSSEKQLLERCVPGWLWAGELAGSESGGEGKMDRNEDEDEQGCEAECEQDDTDADLETESTEDFMRMDLDLDALSALYDKSGSHAAAAAPPPGWPALQGPILTFRMKGDPVMALFDRWDWAEEHPRRQDELQAVALKYSGAMVWKEKAAWYRLQAAAAAAGITDPEAACTWPPRLVRLCANPLCGNFSGGGEAELKLRWCSKCRAVKYCSTACQKEHWRQHRGQCGCWVGRWTSRG